METIMPNMIVEWIPYNNLENIKYLTKGGFSEIYTADWINGNYEEWDSKEKQLIRFGDETVILKKLENVESANQSWFEEAKSHLTIKEEQEAFHSKSYDFSIPDDINDFNGSNKQNSSKSSKIIDIFKGSSKELSQVFKKLQINSNNDEKEITQQQTKKQNINIDDDDDDIHNNPNLHSNEQDEFEIPDDGF
ncbi:kinase-like domain-containing protein [Rhizophagus irregularis DAOM 181602=DAOM 197198]|nr:kinase-like domain-containing protein [Rhizophagus irregularis DAOM 181602=DAOM 197198]